MPYILTHTAFGYEVLEALGQDPEAASPNFYLGCCGPDPYFFYQPLKSLFKRTYDDLGHKFHSLPADRLFSAMLPAIDQVEKDFMRGMVCHFCLDAAAHPYITSRPRSMGHSLMEVVMDMQLYPAFSKKTLTPTQRQRGADLDRLDLYMSRTAEKATGADAPGVYKASAHAFLTLMKLSYDPTGRKRKVLSVLERPFTKPGNFSGYMLTEGIPDELDVMNANHIPWRNPKNPEVLRHECFTELYALGLEEAVRCLKLLNQGDTEGFLSRVARNCMEYGPMVAAKETL